MAFTCGFCEKSTDTYVVSPGISDKATKMNVITSIANFYNSGGDEELGTK